MKNSKKALILLTAALCLFLLSGCYTRLMTYQGEVTEGGSNSGCTDCREEVPYTGSQRVCVWERDLFGYPELRCYYTGYASSWLYFHNTPWWYRSSYGWRDTRGCPPYYYYDRSTGTCRYYGGSYPGPNPGTGGGGGGGGGAVAGYAKPRPQSRGGVPSGTRSTEETPASVTEGSGLPPMFSGSANKTLSPVGAPSSTTSSPSNPGGGMSKPQGSEVKQPDPPVEQKQDDRKQGNDRRDRPHPSGRGM